MSVETTSDEIETMKQDLLKEVEKRIKIVDKMINVINSLDDSELKRRQQMRLNKLTSACYAQCSAFVEYFKTWEDAYLDLFDDDEKEPVVYINKKKNDENKIKNHILKY
jgi:S-adenosylmethionine hydrolase